MAGTAALTVHVAVRGPREIHHDDLSNLDDVTVGMRVAHLGSIKVTLSRRLEIDEARVGALVSMFGFATIPVMLVMGFLTDPLDKQGVVIS